MHINSLDYRASYDITASDRLKPIIIKKFFYFTQAISPICQPM